MSEETTRDTGEDRIDEHAIDCFAAMGFNGRLPDKLVETYIDMKNLKDRIYAGRMSPEGLALCIILSGVLDEEDAPKDVEQTESEKENPPLESGDKVKVSIKGEMVDAVVLDKEPKGKDSIVVKVAGDARASREVKLSDMVW